MHNFVGSLLIPSLSLFVLACGQTAELNLGSEALDVEPEMQTNGSALTRGNGIHLPNGLNLPNGFNLGNGIILGNGLNLGNGINLPNGINLSSGIVQGLPARQLSPAPGSDLERWIDRSPTMRKRILKYLVECALPASVTIKLKYRGVTSTLGSGAANLGPSLQNGAMTTVDQEKVSACLLARLNAKGETVMVNMMGPFPQFNSITSADKAKYSVQEGAFFGNLFVPTPKAYFCQIASVSASNFRACVQPDGSVDCGILSLQGGFMGCEKSISDFTRLSAECRGDVMGGLSNSNYLYSCNSGGRAWNNIISTRLEPR